MVTQVIKQFEATINSETSFTWFMANANPPFPDVPFSLPDTFYKQAVKSP